MAAAKVHTYIFFYIYQYPRFVKADPQATIPAFLRKFIRTKILHPCEAKEVHAKEEQKKEAPALRFYVASFIIFPIPIHRVLYALHQCYFASLPFCNHKCNAMIMQLCSELLLAYIEKLV